MTEFTRLQPVHHETRRRCSERIEGRRLPCNRKATWWTLFKSWAGGNGSAYRCELHKPPITPTHRAGGLPLNLDGK